MARADKWMEPFGNPIDPIFGRPIYGDPGTIVAGASAVSGLLGSDSADSAAKASAKATAASNALLQKQIGTNTSDFAPYRTLGPEAVARLSYLLGLTPAYSNPDELAAANAKQMADYNDHGAAGGRDFLYNAAKAQGKLPAYYQLLSSGALDEATKTSKSSKLRLIASTANPSAPTPLKPLDTSDGQYGSLMKNFSNEDFVKDPGYQFRLDEGLKGIDRASSARGGYDSGATLKALARYNQDYASNEFGNAYNRDANNKSRIYNFLSGSTNTGLTATNNNAAINSNLMTGMASNTMQNGMNQANYGMQGAESINNAIQGGIGNYLYNQRTNTPVVSGTFGGGYGGYSTNVPWYLS